MATILFSSITNGSTVAFNPASDVLSFDLTSISAASVSLSYAADYTSISIMAGGKTFSLTSTVSLASLTTDNVIFADGSKLIVGDNSTVANDIYANTLIGSSYNDQLFGLAGADTLVGGAGNDRLDGGSGSDLMKGGLGSDTYIVDETGDVVDETPTVDTILVSTDAAGVQGNGASGYAQISSDGRYVVFESNASNLLAGDTNSCDDIFIKDLQTGAIQRVSTDAAGEQGNNGSYNAQFSSDGRYVAFESLANNLVAGDNNGCKDIFIKDLQTGEIKRVSTDIAGEQGNAGSDNARISSDGRYVVFESLANNLVAGDNNGCKDIFIKDLQTGEIKLVSADWGGMSANAGSANARISVNGRYVVFDSGANDIVYEDTNNNRDVFVKDLQTGAIKLVSSDTIGTQSNGMSWFAQISSDGRYVVFESLANNLVAGDTNGTWDIFVKDLQTGEIQRVSTDAAGVQGNGSIYSYIAELSSDGRYVIFHCYASNLVTGDTNGNSDIFRVMNPFIEDTGTDTILSSVSYVLPPAVEHLTLTGNGAINATGNDLDNMLIGNAVVNILTGAAGNDTLNGGSGADLMKGGLGSDNYIVDDAGDVVDETPTADTLLVSISNSGLQCNGDSINAQFSADGRYVVFESYASNLVAGDTNGTWDIFVKDLQTGAIQLVSIGYYPHRGDGPSVNAQFSTDGRYVVFESDADAFWPSYGTRDIFVQDLQTGQIQLVSGYANSYDDNAKSSHARFSADGRYVVFDSTANTLTCNDNNNTWDIFIKDLGVCRS